MALEKFNSATKNEVIENWYPNEAKSYIKFIVKEIQHKLNTNTRSKRLGKNEIKLICKHFGKPYHITDQDYIDYVKALTILNEWE